MRHRAAHDRLKNRQKTVAAPAAIHGLKRPWCRRRRHRQICGLGIHRHKNISRRIERDAPVRDRRLVSVSSKLTHREWDRLSPCPTALALTAPRASGYHSRHMDDSQPLVDRTISHYRIVEKLG